MRITDDERREVARNMRDNVKCKTECELLSINGSSAAIRWLISYVVFGDKKYHSGVDLMNRLADLIEPSCDRDALLKLADEMDHTDSEVGWTDDAMPHFARRIREALGVER